MKDNLPFYLRWRLLFLAVLLSGQTYAQGGRELKGTVMDAATSTALPGVSIVVKGTTRGTQTDAEGKYSIRVESNEVLGFSFIGYEMQEVLIQNQSTLDIQLKPSQTNLDELVVVGYGTMKKRDRKSVV